MGGQYAQAKKGGCRAKKKNGEQEKVDLLTWDDLEELCLGKLGMSFMELDNISMRRLFNKLRGYREKEREEWEKLRLQCYFAFSPIDPDDPEGKRLQGLLDFMPFDWDNDLPKEDYMEKIKADARERRERSQKLWAKIDGIE